MTMSDARSGHIALSDAEFEELLRMAYESIRSNSMKDEKETETPLTGGVQPHRISCM